jgi:hypothetical protein
MKKQKYIRNNIVFDPNIEEDFMDSGFSISQRNRKKYLKGKKKRIRYFGI